MPAQETSILFRIRRQLLVAAMLAWAVARAAAAMPMREVRDAFDAGLKKIRKNGAYAAIYKNYNDLLEL